MKINSLKLHGWTGIKKGMRIDDLELDLSGLSGLIAFSGQNGAGKSTVLENLQPYRTLASRKKALPYHVYTRDAFKALDFDFQGDNYQTKVLIDCDSGRQEGYIWKNGESVVDGKARNYDAYIEALLGSKDLFFNSIFCAQNASKLSDLTTGKLKELFAEFLRLDQYIAYEATTKQCITLLGSQGSAYTAQAASIRTRLEAYGDLEAKRAQAQANLDQAMASHSKTVDELALIDSEIAKAKEAQAANEAIEARAADKKARIAELEKQIETAKTEYETEVSGLRTQVMECTKQIDSQTQILNMQSIIESAVERKKELEAEIAAKEPGISAGYAKREKIRKRLDEIAQEIQTHNAPHPREKDLGSITNRIAMLKAQTADLERRDPECTSTICGFIQTALEAERALPGLKKEWDELSATVQAYDAEQAEIMGQLEAEREGLKTEDKSIWRSIEGLQTRLAEVKGDLTKVSKDANLQGDLREAMARKEAAETRKQELIDRGLKAKSALEKRTAAMEAELTEAKTSYTDIMARINLQVKDRLSNLEAGRTAAATSEREWKERVSDFTSNVRIIQDQITEKAALESQLTELEAKRSQIQGQVSEWIYLRNSLSANGIRALEIDSVAPSISAYANQILFNTFGPAYSVKLRTQDDEGREVLDILAIEQDGRETLLDDLSGGEKCWSLKALRLALTLIAKQKSGKAFQVALSDEEDGSLDAGNAVNFIHMYRAFMETGGFDTCFFISHRPECVAMSDSVIEFGEGGISIN
jgi:DNA repair protein SbcC/Rad50